MRTAGSYAPSDLSYYVWSFPGSPLRVHLSLDVVRRLRERLQSTGTHAAQEGLLFGKAIEGATEVLEFQPADGRIPEAVAATAADGDTRLLVGYYRVEAGDSLRLNDSDRSLARTIFALPHHVFLIVQPAAFGPPAATFFFHDAGGRMAEFSLMEFPFEPSLLAGEERDRLRRSQEAAARRAAAVQPIPPARRRHRGLGRIALAVVVLCGFCGLVMFRAQIAGGFQEWWSRVRVARVEPAAAPSPVPQLSALSMGLRVRRESGDVAVTWNRESPVIAAATSGVLSIQDGDARRDIALAGPEVRTTSVRYSPTTDHISMQLAITTPVNTVIESVVLLLPNGAPPKPDALPVMPPAPSGGAEPASLATVIAQPVPPPPPERNPPGPNGGSEPAAYHPAEPIRKLVPRVPPEHLTALSKPATIEVRVAIDNAGRVTHAEAVPHRGANKLVLGWLVTAARSWTFAPARRGAEPVASEFVLQFHFER